LQWHDGARWKGLTNIAIQCYDRPLAESWTCSKSVRNDHLSEANLGHFRPGLECCIFFKCI